jgi:dephospho-CoA kinase
LGSIIGVTGGIAGGKSLFVSFLAELGAETISADILARDLLNFGTATYSKVVESFGNSILMPGGEIDRSALADIIFCSPEKRQILNNIVHPQVIEQVKQYINIYRNEHANDCTCLVVEVPLLFECNMQGLFDITIVVTVEQGTQMRRLTLSRGMTDTQAKERIASQFSDSEKCRLANVVIYNDGSADELRAKACEFFQSICFPLA